MRVAIPTNDKETIFKRTGRADGFLIIDVDNNGFDVIDYRINTHGHHHHHGEAHDSHDHSHKEIVDSLKDCEYLIVNMIGKHFGKDINKAGIKVYKTDKQNIEEAVLEFTNSEL